MRTRWREPAQKPSSSLCVWSLHWKPAGLSAANFFLGVGKMMRIGGIEKEQWSYPSRLVLLCIVWWGHWEEQASVGADSVVCPGWQQPHPGEERAGLSNGFWSRFLISLCFLTAAVQGLRRRVFDPVTLPSLNILRRDCLQSLCTSIHQRCVYILNAYMWRKLKIAITVFL